jgi:hypothetical protein
LVSIDKKKKNFGSCDEDDQHDVWEHGGIKLLLLLLMYF